jgi:hypothetical protein
MRLPGQLLDTPPVGDTLVTVTLGNTDGVDDLVLLEHAGDADLLLEVGTGKLDLVGDGTAVDLDLHEVGLLLLEAGLGELGVGEDSDDGAVLLDALELAGDRLPVVLGVLLGVTGERLSLRYVPVLVEAALELVGEVLGPNGGQSAETAGSLDVADNTDDDHGGSLDDGNGLDNLALVHLCEGLARAAGGAQAWSGTGAGTALCDSIVLESHATLRVESTHSIRDGQGHGRRGSYRPCNP